MDIKTPIFACKFKALSKEKAFLILNKMDFFVIITFFISLLALCLSVSKYLNGFITFAYVMGIPSIVSVVGLVAFLGGSNSDLKGLEYKVYMRGKYGSFDDNMNFYIISKIHHFFSITCFILICGLFLALKFI